MREMEHMQKVMDEFFKYLESDVCPKEKQAREDECKRENEHRVKEGLCEMTKI
ncbi:MAG: hypothetical protein KAR06_03665 [Deltaproteobacteria bacterium]|nr:hypothetical protein [Deltaproteobacteria bacterium]